MFPAAPEPGGALQGGCQEPGRDRAAICSTSRPVKVQEGGLRVGRVLQGEACVFRVGVRVENSGGL